MKAFYLTDTGRVREHNEDSVKIKNCRGGFKICGESIRKIL